MRDAVARDELLPQAFPGLAVEHEPHLDGALPHERHAGARSLARDHPQVVQHGEPIGKARVDEHGRACGNRSPQGDLQPRQVPELAAEPLIRGRLGPLEIGRPVVGLREVAVQERDRDRQERQRRLDPSPAHQRLEHRRRRRNRKRDPQHVGERLEALEHPERSEHLDRLGAERRHEHHREHRRDESKQHERGHASADQKDQDDRGEHRPHPPPSAGEAAARRAMDRRAVDDREARRLLDGQSLRLASGAILRGRSRRCFVRRRGVGAARACAILLVLLDRHLGAGLVGHVLERAARKRFVRKRLVEVTLAVSIRHLVHPVLAGGGNSARERIAGSLRRADLALPLLRPDLDPGRGPALRDQGHRDRRDEQRDHRPRRRPRRASLRLA